MSQVVKAEALASVGYEASVIASGAERVKSLLDKFDAEPSTGNLHHGLPTSEASASVGVEGSLSQTAAADDTMLARTSVTHFVELVREAEILQLVRVQKRCCRPDHGHLIALGQDGFFFCTCLEIITKGLPCRHAIVALLRTQAVFNWACLTPRWRKHASRWIMAPFASKPARLASVCSAEPMTLRPIATCPSAFSHSQDNVRSMIYANCCATGERLAGMVAGITSIGGVNRVLDRVMEAAAVAVAREEAQQR